ncbi:hypothetical protein EDB89DRAFT_2013297 [Lactarius sanguifluus]|nr:hypothetical protein EDB89DRAFT_2013297 [Lactarius sanguifluus]
MGFFHKFLSLGSRRSKKRRAASRAEARAVPPLSREELRRQQEEQEEVASRLLRSSSLRYAVVNEVDYSALPPLPHPVNSLNRPQITSPSRSSSIQTRRTYTALTEFPNANPPLETPTRHSHDRTDSFGRKYPPVTPKDQNRLHVLRQDPSVASLLNMYDNQGHLDSKAFSNTPPASEKESSGDGRAQVKRGGSTLRQLLGNPESNRRASTAEGDISWAEAFLLEAGRSNDESTPSIYLETCKDAVVCGDAPETNTGLSSDSPYPVDFITRPAVSSMAVEPSFTSDESSASNLQQPTRPAAEVFGFLLEKRRPSNSMPTSVGPTPAILPATRNASLPAKRGRTASATTFNLKQSSSRSNILRPAELSASADTPSSNGSILVDPPRRATTLDHTHIPLTNGSLPDGPPVGQLTVMATATRVSRIPRGRRSLQLPSDSPTLNPETQLRITSPTETDKSTMNNYDVLRLATNTTGQAHVAASHLTSERDATSVLAPKRSARRRSVSHGPTRLIPSSWNALPDTTGAARPKELKSDDGKENTLNPASTDKDVGLYSSGKPKSRLPVTPSHEKALLSPVPSPASSSELSPLGRKMMANLRKQRRVRGERRTDQTVVHYPVLMGQDLEGSSVHSGH